MPVNLDELKKLCKEKWTKFLHNDVERDKVIHDYFKFLLIKMALKVLLNY